MTAPLDAVVVGGGLSGLVAARALAAHGVERVAVLEAREEAGGACLQRTSDGHVLECGGGWTAAGQTHAQQLARELGVATYRGGAPDGKVLRLRDGVPEYLEPGDLGVSEAAEPVLLAALEELERLIQSVPPERPWEAPDAMALDRINVETWMRQQTDDPEVLNALARVVETTTSTPRQISLLSFLAFFASAGGLEGIETEADELFEGGAGQLTLRMAAELGDRLRLGWPVVEVAWDDDGVTVTGLQGSLRARRAIFAITPAEAARIAFAPGLPTARQLLHKGWLSTSVMKTNVVFETPFWQQPDGDRPALGGWSVNDGGCPTVVLDASPREGVGVLAAFTVLVGEDDRFTVPHAVLDDPLARRELLLRNLVLMYGEQAANPLTVQETHWGQEPWIGGCLSFAPPGLLTQAGYALREPVGPLHWAGAATADRWINHLSGAVQAGERAAAEVADALAATAGAA